MKAQVDDLVIWSSNNNWRIGVGIVAAVHRGTPYVMPINDDGTFGRKQRIGFNHMVVARNPISQVQDERLDKALLVWIDYLKVEL